MSGVAYKLVDRSEWIAALAAGAYAGSAVDRSDGYIHRSTAAQLAETARRRELVLVEVDLAPLGAALKWEPSRGGDLFPHLFAPLPASADAPQRGLSVDADGIMRFEDGAVGWP
jgi:uncharacterized protein (DUF952 family)